MISGTTETISDVAVQTTIIMMVAAAAGGGAVKQTGC